MTGLFTPVIFFLTNRSQAVMILAHQQTQGPDHAGTERLTKKLVFPRGFPLHDSYQ